MSLLNSQNLILRSPEPSDIDFLYDIENRSEVWEVSNTQVPYSRHILEEYIINANQDIYVQKQIRFMICNLSNQAIGTIDFFDFEPFHQRAGIGIYLIDEERKKGYAKETLQLICEYGFKVIGLHQIYCGISVGNTDSIYLFESCGFQKSGQKIQWRKNRDGNFEDELIYQLFRPQ